MSTALDAGGSTSHALKAVGEQEFRFDSGRICLNLLATAHPEERLDSVDRLRAWCTVEGLVQPGPGGGGARAAGESGGAVPVQAVGRAGAGCTDASRTDGSRLAASHADAGRVVRDAGGPVARGGCAASGQDVLPAADLLWLVALRELRGHMGQLVRGELDGRPVVGSLEHINAAAREAPPAPCAVRGTDGALVRALHTDPGCTALLALLARDAVDLLTDPVARGRLRRCEGDNCPLIYLDTSRGRRRRWCSSEVCGNRERVARHRRRAALARA